VCDVLSEIKLDVFFSARKAVDEHWGVVGTQQSQNEREKWRNSKIVYGEPF